MSSLTALCGRSYDVVVANIVADVIMGLAPWCGILKPGGLFLSPALSTPVRKRWRSSCGRTVGKLKPLGEGCFLRLPLKFGKELCF